MYYFSHVCMIYYNIYIVSLNTDKKKIYIVSLNILTLICLHIYLISDMIEYIIKSSFIPIKKI